MQHGGLVIDFFYLKQYRMYPKYSDRQTKANSVDPDQTPQNAASDQGLHYLSLIQQCLERIKRACLNFRARNQGVLILSENMVKLF